MTPNDMMKGADCIADRLEALCRPDRRRRDGAIARRTKETVPCSLLRAAAQEIRALRAALQMVDREAP